MMHTVTKGVSVAKAMVASIKTMQITTCEECEGRIPILAVGPRTEGACSVLIIAVGESGSCEGDQVE